MTTCVGFIALMLMTAVGTPPVPEALQAVRFDQRLGERVPLDAPFHDHLGHRVTLGDALEGKPTVLVLAYYRCPMLCSLVLRELVETLRRIEYDVGDRFNVVVVSIDPREEPATAAATRRTLIAKYGRAGSDGGWRLLTGAEASSRSVADAVGFGYAYDAASDQYAHPAGIVVLTPTGEVSRYLLGVDYPARDLRLALIEASQRKIGSPVDAFLLRCFHYDPNTGRYTLAVMNVIRGAGVATLAVLGGFVTWALRRESCRRAETLNDT